MKKMVMVLILLSLVLGPIFAQSTPQIAFTFLDDYIKEKEGKEEMKKAGILGLSVGTALVASSGVAWFFGDEISMELSEDGQSWDTTSKYIMTGALVAGGVLSLGTGAVLLLLPPHDYRGEYAHIYEEDDPLLREAFSAAALKGLAESGRTDRLIAGWIDLSIPIVTVATQVSMNVSGGRPWHEDVLSVSVSQIWQIASGVYGVFFKKSGEESLFEEYQAARDVSAQFSPTR